MTFFTTFAAFFLAKLLNGAITEAYREWRSRRAATAASQAMTDLLYRMQAQQEGAGGTRN